MHGLMRGLTMGVSKAAKRLGYRIERADGLADMPRLDVFELAAHELMATVARPFLLQIGAFDGVTQDPVRHLILRHGWRGLLVEPQPGAYARLVANYADHPAIRLENAALGDRDGTVTLYMPAADDGTPLVTVQASFSEATLRKHTGGRPICSAVVPTWTVKSLLARHHVERVDILQIDTEGFDAQAVRMVLEAGCEPALIRYEHVHLSTSERRDCADRLAARGYRLHRDQIDTIAYRPPAG